jgi:rRNA maturation RNase YbeY
MPEINFFSEQSSFKLPKENESRTWIKQVISSLDKELQDLNFIFTTDEYLHNINKQYLQHDDFTDIITFDYSDIDDEIEGEIYISIDRVKENANKFQETFKDELHRVMVHGILHLSGYNDRTETEKEEMRNYENHYLALRGK